MEAHALDFNFMKNEYKLIIPFFQRAYVWQKEQWEQLFEDLYTSYVEDREHFLGSIILKRNSGTNNECTVIDGQQRLTTFSLLIKNLIKRLPDQSQIYFIDYLYETFDHTKAKIHHSRVDRESYNIIINDENDNIIKSKRQYHGGLIECYLYFNEIINNRFLNEEDVFNFAKYIVSSRLWVTIHLDSDEDEQKIFDSINTTGLKLTSTDIVKNTFFDKAFKLGLDAEKLYLKYWLPVFEENFEIQTDWNTESRNKRVKSEMFLHAFAVIFNFFDPERHSLENLSNLYKTKIHDLTKDSFEDFIQQLNIYAKIYRDLPVAKKDTYYSYANHEQRLFHIVEETDTNTVLPLILALKVELGSNEEELYKIYNIIEVYIMLRWVANKSSKNYNILFSKLAKNIIGFGNDYNKIANLLIENFNTSSDYIKIPSANEIKDVLYNIQDNKRAKLVLFWIELYKRYESKNLHDQIELIYNYTLEHLMPQNWHDYWDIGENEEYMISLIYQIGNMTILRGSLNSAISNNCWNVKLNGTGNYKNYIKKYADLILNKDLLDKEKWDATEITQRTEILIKIFFKIWNIELIQVKVVD